MTAVRVTDGLSVAASEAGTGAIRGDRAGVGSGYLNRAGVLGIGALRPIGMDDLRLISDSAAVNRDSIVFSGAVPHDTRPVRVVD